MHGDTYALKILKTMQRKIVYVKKINVVDYNYLVSKGYIVVIR